MKVLALDTKLNKRLGRKLKSITEKMVIVTGLGESIYTENSFKREILTISTDTSTNSSVDACQMFSVWQRIFSPLPLFLFSLFILEPADR